MSAYSILVAARAKIADINHFTQGAFARDKDGVRIHATNQNACRFCSLGAVQASTPKLSGNPKELDHRQYRQAEDVLTTVATSEGYRAVVMANDAGVPEIAHPRILSIFDEAIRIAKDAQ